MKLAAIVTMAAVAAVSAQAKIETGRPVVIYLQDNAEVPYFVKTQAKYQAAHMFSAIGISLVWKSGRPSPSETDAIAIELTGKTPASQEPGAMAFALPYEGVHIRMFWDRMSNDPAPEAVLAHVMVHEITHILQGVARHSAEGIMKAFWNSDDRAMLRRKPLGFAAEDVQLINAGMAARAAHTTKPGALTATIAAVQSATE